MDIKELLNKEGFLDLNKVQDKFYQFSNNTTALRLLVEAVNKYIESLKEKRNGH
jgi:hypothetical protein